MKSLYCYVASCPQKICGPAIKKTITIRFEDTTSLRSTWVPATNDATVEEIWLSHHHKEWNKRLFFVVIICTHASIYRLVVWKKIISCNLRVLFLVFILSLLLSVIHLFYLFQQYCWDIGTLYQTANTTWRGLKWLLKTNLKKCRTSHMVQRLHQMGINYQIFLSRKLVERNWLQ